jgi:hypothetical protein
MYRFQPLLFQPVPSLLGYSLSELAEEVRSVHFPEIEERVEVRFAAESPLASMTYNFMGRDKHLMRFHPVLNHPGTPVEVLRFIAKHELTHIVRRGCYIDGRYEAHPPEFWEHERALGPEYYAVWHWIYTNLGPGLRRGRLDGSVRVTKRWRNLRESPRTPYTPTLPFNGERWERVCPGVGSQLLLPPDWAVRPLPLTHAGA